MRLIGRRVTYRLQRMTYRLRKMTLRPINLYCSHHFRTLKWIQTGLVSLNIIFWSSSVMPRSSSVVCRPLEDDLQTTEDDLQTKEDDLDITDIGQNLLFPFN